MVHLRLETFKDGLKEQMLQIEKSEFNSNSP